MTSLANQGLPNTNVSVSLIIVSIVGIGLAWFASFRLGIANLEFAWQVNFERLALALTAGLAFGGCGAEMGYHRKYIKTHIIGFALISTMSAAWLAGAFGEWPLLLTVLASVAIGVVTYLLVSFALKPRWSMNLWSALILLTAFGLTVANFLAASLLGGKSGKLVYWLQGSLFDANGYSAVVLLLGLILFAWLLSAKVKDIPVSLLIGLGIGIAGPLFFVACVVPLLVRSLSGSTEGRLFVITCAAVGALLVVLADSAPSLLIGGYSPSLLVPISLVSIPILLHFQRAMVRRDFPSQTRELVETGIIVAWLVGSLFVIFHIVQFASSAA